MRCACITFNQRKKITSFFGLVSVENELFTLEKMRKCEMQKNAKKRKMGSSVKNELDFT